jgi:hypothetical protein
MWPFLRDAQAAELLVKWAERRADAIIEKHWPKVQRLAAAITEKQKFTGNGVFSHAEIKQVLRGDGRNGER